MELARKARAATPRESDNSFSNVNLRSVFERKLNLKEFGEPCTFDSGSKGNCQVAALNGPPLEFVAWQINTVWGV